MSPLGALHLATAFVAIGTGAIILLTGPKGGRTHKRLGWVYLGSMLALNGSALLIYKLFGGFGPFHVAAIVSLLGIFAGGTLAVKAREARKRGDRVRRAELVAAHFRAIAWSYIGLLAALVSETATRLDIARPAAVPGRAFGIAVGVATMTVVAIGAYLISARRERVLAPFTSRSAPRPPSSQQAPPIR
jgi:uncharacterized membrane protein